jgi:hypothetical protein
LRRAILANAKIAKNDIDREKLEKLANMINGKNEENSK